MEAAWCSVPDVPCNGGCPGLTAQIPNLVWREHRPWLSYTFAAIHSIPPVWCGSPMAVAPPGHWAWRHCTKEGRRTSLGLLGVCPSKVYFKLLITFCKSSIFYVETCISDLLTVCQQFVNCFLFVWFLKKKSMGERISTLSCEMEVLVEHSHYVYCVRRGK